MINNDNQSADSVRIASWKKGVSGLVISAAILLSAFSYSTSEAYLVYANENLEVSDFEPFLAEVHIDDIEMMKRVFEYTLRADQILLSIKNTPEKGEEEISKIKVELKKANGALGYSVFHPEKVSTEMILEYPLHFYTKEVIRHIEERYKTPGYEGITMAEVEESGKWERMILLADSADRVIYQGKRMGFSAEQVKEVKNLFEEINQLGDKEIFNVVNIDEKTLDSLEYGASKQVLKRKKKEIYFPFENSHVEGMVSSDEGHRFVKWGTEKNVPGDKVWHIDVVSKLKEAAVTKQNVFVLDANGQKVESIEISVSSNGRTIIVKNTEEYREKETYQLFITPDIETATGRHLKNGIKMFFVIEEFQSETDKILELEKKVQELSEKNDSLSKTLKEVEKENLELIEVFKKGEKKKETFLEHFLFLLHP